MNKVLPSRQTARNSIGFKSTANVRRAIALLIAVTSLNVSLPSLPGVFASPRPGPAIATGIMSVAGTVTIDGARAISGQTIFPGCYIVTSEASESIIDLNQSTRLRLLPQTELALNFSTKAISARLTKGTLRGFIPLGLPVNIQTDGGEVTTDPSQKSEFTVQVAGDSTKVSVTAGRVEIKTRETLHRLSAGDVFTTGTGGQTQPERPRGITNRQKVGLFAALGGAATILVYVMFGRNKSPEEPQFDGCVIVPSGVTGQTCSSP